MTLNDTELDRAHVAEAQALAAREEFERVAEPVVVREPPPPPLARLAASQSRPQVQPQIRTQVRPEGGTVIGPDISIQGRDLKIVTQGELRIDGEIQGDVIGATIIIGPRGTVSGRLFARDAVIEGRVRGSVKAVDVKLTSTAAVNGELLHLDLSLERGAWFDGQSIKAQSENEILREFADLMPVEGEFDVRHH